MPVVMNISSIFDRLLKFSGSIVVKLLVPLIGLLCLSFIFITLITINFFTSLYQEDVLSNAVQVSNLIKRATYHTMLENRREDLSNIIANIGQDEQFLGIRIYNKLGVITFSDKKEELGQMADKKAEQCYICHAEEPALGVIPTKDLARIFISPQGYRILGVINPIENEPSCYTALCHAHSPQDNLLGLLDVKLSLQAGDVKIADARNKMILFIVFVICLTMLVIWFVVHKIIGIPVRHLNEATLEVANLNLEHKVQMDSRDELGNLADSFNKMIDQLHSARQALRNWSRSLEERVNYKSKELEKTQAQLIFAEKMASVGELSAMVAHEINNPLSGILYYAKVTDKYLADMKEESETLPLARRNLATIAAEAARCGQIVKNLLALTKKSTGEFKEEHLNSIVHNVLKVVNHSLKVKEISLDLDLMTGDDNLQGDLSAIQQLLLVLLVNAMEASDKGRRLFIRTGPWEGEDKLAIWVTDEGAGIPEEILPRIFEPFFSTKPNNTGLGLSLAYSVAEQHSGEIRVDTKIGKGTTFIVILPRKPAKQEQVQQVKGARPLKEKDSAQG